jgi:serine/threonine-protein kinase
VSDALIGQEIADGQFRVLERIGAGGMGAVYKAEQPSMNRFVAVKVLHQKYLERKDVVSRFRREARAMSQLTHPNTARVTEYGQLPDESLYFVMEYLQGRNLAQHVRADGPMEEVRAINVMIQVCGALEEAHRAGIIHRDLKPENIFLTNQGGIDDFPKVLDFGLAKVTEKQMGPNSMMLTKQGMVFGTPEFMSPEQAQGESLDARTDIYSLALIMYELVTGKLPFDATRPVDIMKAQVKDPPIPLSERVPGKTFTRELETTLMRALSKRREDRPASALEFGLQLKACMSGSLGNTAAHRALPGSSSNPPARATPAALVPALVAPQASASFVDEPEVPTSRAPLVLLGAAIGIAIAGVAFYVLVTFFN